MVKVSGVVSVIIGSALAAVVTGQSLEIPQEIIRDMASMVLGALNVMVSGCEPVDLSGIEYIYFNKQNFHKPITLTLLNAKQELIPKIPTKMIIHGWFGSAIGPNGVAMKDAYLKRGNYNIIFVNWESHAKAHYAQAHCGLAQIGQNMGDFVYDLHRLGKLKLRKLHLIGHSLGAHLAGFIGQRIQQRTGGRKIGRITGLDAAGPGFFGFHEDNRLDESDAVFVDGIHTNGAQFGYPRNFGTVDFYPNCGLFQPGCLDFDLSDNSTILKQTMDNLACSHNRSVEYFVESITTNGFVGAPFESCYLFHKCASSSGQSGVVMGEDTPSNVTGSYCLVTNSKPPFARG